MRVSRRGDADDVLVIFQRPVVIDDIGDDIIRIAEENIAVDGELRRRRKIRSGGKHGDKRAPRRAIVC